MKYIKSRSTFLSERKKYNLILEGGLENDINWGDSLLGRLFMSVFRKGSNMINSKRIDGLANSLRGVLSESVKKSITDENPELLGEINKFEKRLSVLSNVDGLLEVLKKADIKNIQLFMDGMPDDNIEEVINTLTNKRKESIDVLLAIQEWKKEEEKNVEKEEEDIEEVDVEEVGGEELTGSTASSTELTTTSPTELTTTKQGSSTELTTTKSGELTTTNTGIILYNKIIKNLKDLKGVLNDISSKGNNKKSIGSGKYIKKGDEIEKKGKNILTTNTDEIEDAQIVEKLNIDDILMFLNEDLNTQLSIKSGDIKDIKFGIEEIDRLINNGDKNTTTNIYIIVKEFISNMNININQMCDKFSSEDSDKDNLKVKCIIAYKIALLYSILKQNSNKSDNMSKFIESMEDVLSDINKKSIKYIKEAILSDFFMKDSDKLKLEVRDNKIIDEISFSEETENIKYNYWVNNYLKQSRIKEEVKDIEKKLVELDKKIKTPKYVIDVLEIVKIFKNASRMYIKTVIPSQRTGGKITRAIANQWETTSGGTVDPDRPTGGPFRNIKLYEKWNRLVIDVINEFDYALKREDSRIILSKGDMPIKPKKSIYDFIIEALEGDKISGLGGSKTSEGNQLEFLKGYFGEEDASKIISTIKSKYGDYTTETPKENKKKILKTENVQQVDMDKSRLYKLEINGFLEDMKGGNFLPQTQSNGLYLYIRIKDGKKVGYLFENEKNIEIYKKDGFDFKTSDTEKSNKGIYIVKLGDSLKAGDRIMGLDTIIYNNKYDNVEFRNLIDITNVKVFDEDLTLSKFRDLSEEDWKKIQNLKKTFKNK